VFVWLHLWDGNNAHHVSEEFEARPSAPDHLSLDL
jgi:hypothetical protein